MPTILGDTALIARVRRFVAQHQLAERGTRVVVALSGGSDSVALAHIVRELDAAGELQAAGLVHFNHQLRDDGRPRRAVFGAARANRSAGPSWSNARTSRRGRGANAGRSRTRRARPATSVSTRARATLGADVVALGHTRDDQAETFLLRLLRGAGPKGLAGIHPRHGAIVRPLLSLPARRAAAVPRGASRSPTSRTKRTPTCSIPRNRVRAELLPLLERRFNPAIVDVLADEAELAREMWLWMEESCARSEQSGSVKSEHALRQTSGRLADSALETWRWTSPAHGRAACAETVCRLAGDEGGGRPPARVVRPRAGRARVCWSPTTRVRSTCRAIPCNVWARGSS